MQDTLGVTGGALAALVVAHLIVILGNVEPTL
jgi:hypothetical protein